MKHVDICGINTFLYYPRSLHNVGVTSVIICTKLLIQFAFASKLLITYSSTDEDKSADEYTWKLERDLLVSLEIFLIYLALEVTEVSDFFIDFRVQLTDCKMNVDHCYNRWKMK